MPRRHLILAAQYVRMSTDSQEFSIANQEAAIASYANQFGFRLVRTYSDFGRSGVTLKNRPGLKALLNDILNGRAEYQAILVYDVSRWGRFQNDDQAGHYEFLCKRSGIPVHYCAESFPNDGSMAAALMKSLKRVMASEYSRELGIKTYAGQARIARMGFKIGGSPGYGLRRLMISADGKHRRRLRAREYKSVKTDRVVFVHGPDKEVGCVRNMFCMALRGMGCSDIARELNRRGVKRENGNAWNCEVVRTILTHPKYMGFNVWGRTSQKLHSACVTRPRECWVVRPNSFAAIVSPAVFNRVQGKLRQYAADLRWTDEKLLAKLKELWTHQGRLSETLIDGTPGMPTYSTVQRRFGSLRRAYRLVGYTPEKRAFAGSLKKKQTLRLRDELVRQIREASPNVRLLRVPGRLRPILCLDDDIRVSVRVCPARRDLNGMVWEFAASPEETDFLTLLGRATPGMTGFHSLHVLPRRKWLTFYRFKGDPKWLAAGIRLDNNLSDFPEAARIAWGRGKEGVCPE